MLEGMFLDVLCGLLFLVCLFFSGLRKSQKVQTEESYLLANRKTSFFALTATLVMTELNTATLLSFSSMGYLVGLRALWLPVIFLVGLLFYAASVAKKWKEYNGVSVAGFFSERFGRGIGVVTSLSLFVAMLGFSATYVKSLCLLFVPLFPSLNMWILSSIFTALVLVMMARGGLVAIIRTDVVSFFAVIVFFPMLFYFTNQSGGQMPVISALDAAILPPRFILSLIILTMFTYILAPWYGQKIFAARCQKTAVASVALAAVLVFFLYGLAVCTAAWVKGKGIVLESAELALPVALGQMVPRGFRGLGYGVLFAVSATTLSGVWSAMCTLLVGDFFRKGAKSYHRSMTLMVVCGIGSLFMANILVDRVFDKLILANIPVAALSFALLGGFYWPRVSQVGVYVSMVVGWFAGNLLS